jgi:hypothetical protein
VLTFFRERNIQSLLVTKISSSGASSTKIMSVSSCVPVSADWASFARTLLVKNRIRASPPLVPAVLDHPSTTVQQRAKVVRRKVSTICGVGISDQDRSDLPRLLLECVMAVNKRSISLAFPPICLLSFCSISLTFGKSHSDCLHPRF